MPKMPDQRCPSESTYRHPCTGPTGKLKVCPYQEDVNNDPGALCDCCDQCRNDCGEDI